METVLNYACRLPHARPSVAALVQQAMRAPPSAHISEWSILDEQFNLSAACFAHRLLDHGRAVRGIDGQIASWRPHVPGATGRWSAATWWRFSRADAAAAVGVAPGGRSARRPAARGGAAALADRVRALLLEGRCLRRAQAHAVPHRPPAKIVGRRAGGGRPHRAARRPLRRADRAVEPERLRLPPPARRHAAARRVCAVAPVQWQRQGLEPLLCVGAPRLLRRV